MLEGRFLSLSFLYVGTSWILVLFFAGMYVPLCLDIFMQWQNSIFLAEYPVVYVLVDLYCVA